MLRKGFYAIYEEQEYHWEEKEDTNRQSIYTHDISKTDASFIPCRGADGREIYKRDVQEADLRDIYSVAIYALGEEYIKMKVEKETEEQYFVHL